MMRCFRAVVLMVSACSAFAAYAQSDSGARYPNRPVRLIVPYPAGSAVDHSGRIVGKELSDELNQRFVVDNRPGASTLIGAELAAKSTPDGYTLLVTTNTTSAANKSLFRKLPYDPLKDFTHVGRMNTTSLVLVVRPDFPAGSLREFVAHAKSRNPPLSAGYWSAGSQVAVSTMKTLGGIDLLPVPYKGSPLAVTDLLGGAIAMTFTDFASALPQAKAGKLRAVAVSSRERSPLLPDVPALSEQLPGFDVTTWIGLVAPAGTPSAVVDQLNRALNKALSKPEIKAQFAALGLDVAPMSPGEFTRFVTAEIEKWKKQVADAGIPPQ